MPTAPARCCSHPGCSKLNCIEHRRADVKASRASFDRSRRDDTHRSIYRTAQWQRTRKYVLARDPLCKIAKRCVERYGMPMPSTEADHIVRLREWIQRGGDPFDADNLQGACHADHSAKTAAGG